jgi:hypothetical protein
MFDMGKQFTPNKKLFPIYRIGGRLIITTTGRRRADGTRTNVSWVSLPEETSEAMAP